MNFNFAQQGWQCPVCKTVYSPSTPVCFYCNPNAQRASVGTRTGVEGACPYCGTMGPHTCMRPPDIYVGSSSPRGEFSGNNKPVGPKPVLLVSCAICGEQHAASKVCGVTCPDCMGKGCARCKGLGLIKIPPSGGNPCSVCAGHGLHPTGKQCPRCLGSGVEP